MREASGAAPGLASLPDGGGGVAPLGDRFEPDLVRGSGSYAVPFHLPKGPNEQQPSLGLTYSTGSGNGPFGLGWRLSVPRIERRSDRGLPRYDDDQDTFVFGDGEELVDVGGGRYRPRTDSKGWSIVRDAAGWTIRTGDGTTLTFGQTAASREADGGRIFAWHLDAQRDAAGNTIAFTYRVDGGRLYLDEVRWSIFTARVLYEPRPDVLRNGRAGFLRLTALRARAVQILSARAVPSLLRTYDVTYATARNGSSLLTRVDLSATVDGQTARFPRLDFSYADFDPARWRVDPLRAVIAPPSARDTGAQWVDLTGDGLPDLLEGSGTRLRLWRNRGDGWLDGPTVVADVPATITLDRPNVAFADLNGDGRVDLFAVDQPLQLAYTSDGRGGFAPDPVVFRDRPTLRLTAADTRLVDVDGDGVTDLLQTGRSAFLLSRHVPARGWQEPEAVPRLGDLDLFPDVTLGDKGVHLADMTGDGLEDIVFVRGRQAWYWPSLGHGRWGARVEMLAPPQLPAGFRDDRVVLLDVDGDGCTDVLYLDADRTLIWINRAGTGFAPPIEIPAVPAPQARVLPLDLFGDGRAGLVWGTPAAVDDDAGYRALRFDVETRPYVLITVRNGMGRVLTMAYATSTAVRRRDADSGTPWTGTLPFVVPVVSTIVDEDTVSGSRAEMSIRYRDAVYDGPRREFRGFAHVSVELAGDSSIPASRQEYTFFQGDPEHVDLIERDRQRALAGTQVRVRAFTGESLPFTLAFETTQEWDVAEDVSPNGARVFVPRLRAAESREVHAGGDPDRRDRTTYGDYDGHGNARTIVRECFAEGGAPADVVRVEQRLTFLSDETRWLVKLPVRRERRDGAGVPLEVEIHHYDGAPFEGLPEGSATKGLVTRSRVLALRADVLPADYAAGVDFAALGYDPLGAGATAGHYATTLAVERDARGNVTRRRDPLGRITTVTFDADGVYPVESRDSLGRTTVSVFDARAGSPARLELPNGQVYRWIFDPLGRPQARFELNDAGAEQLVTAWSVDVSSVPTSITTVSPHVAGRTLAELTPPVDPAGLADVSASRTYFDGQGKRAMQVASAPDAADGSRRFLVSGRTRRNARGLAAVDVAPVSATDLALVPPPAAIDGSAVRYRYDGRGNLVETAGRGPVHFRVMRDTFTLRHFEGAAAGAFGSPLAPGDATRVEHFDASSRIVRIDEIAGDGTTVTTGYDVTADSRVGVMREGGAEVTRYTYAGPGEAIRIAHRDAGTRTYYRDAAGLVTRMIAADGAQLHYAYDAGGRLRRLEHQAPGLAARTLVREYLYDGDDASPVGRFLEGRLAAVRDGALVVRFAYDRAGRSTSESFEIEGRTLTIRRAYGLQGDLTAVVYPDGRRVELTRGGAASIREIPGILTAVHYDDEGALDRYTCANGVEIRTTHDAESRRLTSTSAQSPAGVLRRLDYSYDVIGNITRVLDTLPGSTLDFAYAYDGLHRLRGFEVRADGPAGALQRTGTYTLKGSGDVLAIQEDGNATLTYGDAAHGGRVTSVTRDGVTAALTYDAGGRITAFGDLATIEYDALDRVSRIVKQDGTTIRFVDDHLGRPVLRVVTRGGVTARTMWAADLYEARDDRAIRSIFLGSRRVAREVVAPAAGGAVTLSFPLADHHGSEVADIGAAGTIHQRYLPFGRSLLPPAALDRYVGHDVDADTRLVHLGARLYAPAIGRFLSPDWYVLENPEKPMRMPQGYNVYAYAMNNPLAFEDPSGRWFFLPFVAGFVVGLIYGIADGRSGDASWSLAKETALTTGLGYNLGWLTGMAMPVIGGTSLAAFTGAMGGMNGLLAGTRQIYDDIQFFGSAEGIASLVADSTWGILGTTIGNAANINNLIAAPSSYRSDLSKGQNRQVYDRGFFIERTAAFTQGNTISNLATGKGQGGDPGRLLHHESLHIFQSRMFGPLFQVTYVAWLVYGGAFGALVGGYIDGDWAKGMRDVGYDDNPWEYWAYQHGGSDSKSGKLAY